MASDTDPFELVAELSKACKQGEKQKVVDLLRSDEVLSIINVPNEEGDTALYCACESGHASIILELLKIKSIDTQIASLASSYTPLHVVCVKKFAECAALLLAAGADIHAKNRENESPRDIAKGSEVYFVLNSWDAKSSTKALLELRRKYPSIAEIDADIAALEDPHEKEKGSKSRSLSINIGMSDISARTRNMTPRLFPSGSKKKIPIQTDPLLICFDSLVTQSNLFVEKTTIGQFPTTNNLIQNIAQENDDIKRVIARHAQGARILLHKDIRAVIHAFLEVKLEHGTPKEKALYEVLKWNDFVRRLIMKRPLAFFTKDNMTLLRNGQIPAAADWNHVGKDKEFKITLEDYMTFDEMQISAMIGVSVPTYFINCGSRTNAAKLEDGYPLEGVFVGLVGARFEQKQYMEAQHMLISESLTTVDNGYGPTADPKSPKTILLRIWARFYRQRGTKKDEFYFPTFKEVDDLWNSNQTKAEKMYRRYKPTASANHQYFNVEVYKKRIVNFLSDANARAADQETKAYCSVVGLGLGAWQVLQEQGIWMLEAYEDCIANNSYPHIANINFKWFNSDLLAGSKYRDMTHMTCTLTGRKIPIEFSKQELIPILDDQHKDKLHVAMYAWDGNSYPGNEYWQQLLTASGDPAAACCSTIPQLQNPEINSYLISNPLWVAGEDDSMETESSSALGSSTSDSESTPSESTVSDIEIPIPKAKSPELANSPRSKTPPATTLHSPSAKSKTPRSDTTAMTTTTTADASKPKPPPKLSPKTNHNINFERAASHFHAHGPLFGFKEEAEAVVKVDFKGNDLPSINSHFSNVDTVSPEQYCKPHGQLFGFDKSDQELEMKIENQLLTPRSLKSNDKTLGKKDPKMPKKSRPKTETEKQSKGQGEHKNGDSSLRSSSEYAKRDHKSPKSPAHTKEDDKSDTPKRSDSRHKKDTTPETDEKKDKKPKAPPKPVKITSLETVLPSSNNGEGSKLADSL